MNNDEMLDVLLHALIEETKAAEKIPIPADSAGKWVLLRTLMNIRPPMAVRPELLDMQDRLLAAQREQKGVTDPGALPTLQKAFPGTHIPFARQLVLWRGDITTLAASAIVNAANSSLLGCFIPHHRCIDNAIHSAAGIQLRLECSQIMQAQGHDEPAGQAKMTRGYNLPAGHVLHTVGPIIFNRVSQEDQLLLAACYTACLDLAARDDLIRSVAFCCISTGEFRFPKDLAAQIAVQSVCNWLNGSDGRFDQVIFNVFSGEDDDIYTRLFRTN